MSEQFIMVFIPERITLVKREIVDSTNKVLMELELEGAGSWTIVHALEQTAGRGRHGKDWVSPRGNLFTSTLVKPKSGFETWPQLSFVMSLALVDALSLMVEDSTINVKWPNDVLVNSLKIAGILLETALSHQKNNYLVVGIGINIAHSPADTRYGATCINAHRKNKISVDEVLSVLMNAVVLWYDIWEKSGFEEIRKQWLKRAYGLGRRIKITNTASGKKIGVYKGLSMDGRMVLQEDNGHVELISAGTVTFFDG
jgi:BirA family biotin operon repressor/biotin-[acetyl-CoA-carboxylase] ligase